MANKKKSGKIRIHFAGYMCGLLLITVLLWLFSSVFFTTRKNALTVEIQTMNSKIEEIEEKNQELEIEISALKNKDRIFTVAYETETDSKDVVSRGD